MQQTLIAGDTLQFTTSVPEYPATDGWTLTYRLIPRTSGAVIELVANSYGSDYQVSVPAATTAGWDATDYTWAAYVELSGQRYTVDKGTLTVTPDVGAVTAYDGRSTAARMIADLEAALLTYSTSNGMVSEYAIAGRSMKYRDKAAIIKDLSYWKMRLFNEEEGERLRQGLGSRRRIYVRFGAA